MSKSLSSQRFSCDCGNSPSSAPEVKEAIAEDDDEEVEDNCPNVDVTLLLDAIGKGATAFIGAIGAASNEREGKKRNRNHD